MSNLSVIKKELINLTTKSYSPYSKFKVSCIVLTQQGKYYDGVNVENASYGLTICAERNAIFQAVAKEGKNCKIVAVFIYTPTQIPSAPCGACRQVINEFGNDAKIKSFCDTEEILDEKLSTLLPHDFGPHNL